MIIIGQSSKGSKENISNFVLFREGTPDVE